MTLYNKVGGALKQVQSLPVKINGEIKDISTLYSKKDGALVIVFSSGALIEFMDYPYAIPVASGWQYQPTIKVTRSETLSGVGTRKYIMGDASSMYERALIMVYVVEGGTPQGEYTGGSSQGTGSESEPFSSIRLEYTGYEGFHEYVYLQSGGTVTFIDHADEPQLTAETVDGTVTVSDGIEGAYIDGEWVTVVEDGDINRENINDWDLSGAYAKPGYPGEGSYPKVLFARGIVGTTPVCSTVEISWIAKDGTAMKGTLPYSNVENGYTGTTSSDSEQPSNGLYTFTLYDADGNILAQRTDIPESSSDTGVTGSSGTVPIYQTIPFTGYVKAKGELSLSEYYNETGVGDTPAQVGLRKDGTALSTARYYASSFVNGDKGYVCGGTTGSASNVVNTYDKSGTRATGTALSTARWGSMSFVNGDYGFVCGGRTASSTASAVTDLYTESSTRTTGTALSYARAYGTGFTHGDYGYVAGGVYSSSTFRNYVERYSTTGTRSTGTALGGARGYLTSFVLGDYAYVCGGQSSSSTYQSTVYKYSTSGSMTTGTSLSITRSMLTSFVNGNKGYVCGGYTGSAKADVDVYNTSGTRSTGTALSTARYEMSSFVLDGYGLVCGGNSSSAVVDVYSESGSRSTGNALSTGRSRASAFAHGDYGFVCGGYTSTVSDVVDMYSHKYETVYLANIPVTEGATYTLNGESGTAEVSEVLTFDSKVTGTIKYKKGDLLPGVQLTVVDASGNVVEGAEITIDAITDRYDLSGAYWTDDSTSSDVKFTWYNVVPIYTGDVAKLLLSGMRYNDINTPYEIEVSIDDPNGTYTLDTGLMAPEIGMTSVILTAYDSAGNVLQTAEIPKQ